MGVWELFVLIVNKDANKVANKVALLSPLFNSIFERRWGTKQLKVLKPILKRCLNPNLFKSKFTFIWTENNCFIKLVSKGDFRFKFWNQLDMDVFFRKAQFFWPLKSIMACNSKTICLSLMAFSEKVCYIILSATFFVCHSHNISNLCLFHNSSVIAM